MSLFFAFMFARANEKPLLVAASGAAGGLGAWFVTWSDHFIRIFQLVGGLFGCLLAVVSFILALPRVLRFVRAWRARGLLSADKE